MVGKATLKFIYFIFSFENIFTLDHLLQSSNNVLGLWEKTGQYLLAYTRAIFPLIYAYVHCNDLKQIYSSKQ